jgi:hypothetical protein
MRRLQQEGREGEVISRFNWNYPPVRFAKLAYWVRCRWLLRDGLSASNRSTLRS